MKRDKFYNIAERMYIEQFITATEIANRIGVNERTVRRWKAKDGWNEKRKKFYDEITVSKDSIYEFSRKMLREIEIDIDNKKHVDSSRYYTFLNFIEQLIKKPRIINKREQLIKVILKQYNF